MPRKAPKTVLRTVRVSQALDDVLVKDADAKSLSVNGLITNIMMKYADWDRNTEKFGFVSITKELFRTLLASCNKAEIPVLAEGLGRKLPKEVMTFFWKKTDLQAFFSYIAAFTKYGGVAQYEMHQDGSEYLITAVHDLGENWSIFLKHFMSAAISSIFGTTAKLEVTSNTVVLRFSPR